MVLVGSCLAFYFVSPPVTRRELFLRVLNFVLLSSIVLTQRLCLKRFLPMSFRLTGLYLLWW